jgi:hypothetical protein
MSKRRKPAPAPRGKPKPPGLVVGLCPTCGWCSDATPWGPGWPPRCGNPDCKGVWNCDWLKVEALPAHIARAEAELARITKIIDYAREACRKAYLPEAP